VGKPKKVRKWIAWYRVDGLTEVRRLGLMSQVRRVVGPRGVKVVQPIEMARQ